jgi:hypothetical protein
MDVAQTISAVLIAGALGALAGSTFSVAGWVFISVLLVVTLGVSACAIGAVPLVSVGLGALVILGFNVGLLAGMLPRSGEAQKV